MWKKYAHKEENVKPDTEQFPISIPSSFCTQPLDHLLFKHFSFNCSMKPLMNIAARLLLYRFFFKDLSEHSEMTAQLLKRLYAYIHKEGDIERLSLPSSFSILIGFDSLLWFFTINPCRKIRKKSLYIYQEKLEIVKGLGSSVDKVGGCFGVVEQLESLIVCFNMNANQAVNTYFQLRSPFFHKLMPMDKTDEKIFIDFIYIYIYIYLYTKISVSFSPSGTI